MGLRTNLFPNIAWFDFSVLFEKLKEISFGLFGRFLLDCKIE